jgi:lysophospholipase L1-like esterase
MPPAKQTAFRVVAIVIGLLVAMALSELVLRAAGFKPWTYTGQDANEPTMHEPDSVLGWRAKKGSYKVPPYHPSGHPIQLTFLENGRRRAGADVSAAFDAELLLVGDSFTQGWAVTDNETYAWKLQENMPRRQVLNYGTAGYGTYQSLLVLERELPRLRQPFVLYGFNEFHEPRNVAAGSWLKSLAQFAKRSQVDVPFATLGADQKLVRHPPERYPSLPYRESLAVMALLEDTYMTVRTRSRVSDKRLVTERLLLEMDKVSRARGAKFAVVLLYLFDKPGYTAFLGRNNIAYIDCAYEIKEEMRVRGEGHPNGEMHSRWARCISQALERTFAIGRPTSPAK